VVQYHDACGIDSINNSGEEIAMSLPNLVIIGAPKAGTTSLFEWLKAHPMIVTSRVKETRYLMDCDYSSFIKGSNYATEGIEGYKKLFPEYQPGQLCVEATPDYMFQQTALKILRDLPSCPMIVVLLRNPVERVLSLYEFARNNRGTLGIGVTARDFFERVKNRQFPNDKILNNALIHSEYHYWLESWIKSCGSSRVQIVFFEDLAKDPQNFMKEFCTLIGVDSHFYQNFTFEAKNQSRQIRSAPLLQVKRIIENRIPTLMESDFIKSIYRKINVTSNVRRSEADAVLLDEMYNYFSVPNGKLALMLQREMPASWAKPS
jgi:hypothetical protein